MPGRALIPKQGAPPYVPMSIADVWGQVREQWKDMYSPEVACPVSEYGPEGGVRHRECVAAYDAAWEKVKDELPDYPKTAPYYELVDLVSVEDICYVGSEPPPTEIPNLLSDPGSLARYLQESWKRSVAAQYCEAPNPDSPPEYGGCFCAPYFCTVGYQTRQLGGGGEEWGEVQYSTSPAWGPIGAPTARSVTDPQSGTHAGWNILISAQEPANFFESPYRCGRNRASVLTAAGSGQEEARIAGNFSCRPFTPAEEEFYFGGSGLSSDPLAECPLPAPQLPGPIYPNTAVYSVPNAPPNINFPVGGPGCPEETNLLEIRVVYLDGQGPPGPPGIDGEKGEDGESTMRRVVRNGGETVLAQENTGRPNDVRCTLPDDCAYIRVDWLSVQSFPKPLFLRQFYSSPNDGKYDEFQLGRIFLSLGGTEGWEADYLQASKRSSLVNIPDRPGIVYDISVTDPYGVGVAIVDIGYRWKDFRWSNPKDIPSIVYQGSGGS